MSCADMTEYAAAPGRGQRDLRQAVPGVWRLADVLPEVLARYGLEAPRGGTHRPSDARPLHAATRCRRTWTSS